ncbi:Flagellar hook protein FlgE [hydrothermal vent metagenome]|uniref:Flagellar hook protein FlgE n=1 Tax=hydrothermal vent metagenome TaxID=652676 RepID=A0A3B1BRC9_9ZZZZ
MPFRIALSGLDAASTDLEVTGNNIANSSTTGFKEARAEFADLYANSIQDVASTAAGRGVRVVKVAQQFSQGNVEFTSNNLDMALNGEGFFILQDTDGSSLYTRAGAFSVDRDGYVVNHANQRLQVYPATTVADVTTFSTGSTTDLLLPTTPGNPSATTSATVSLNLDASGSVPVPAFSTANPTSYNHSTSTTIYDSLGVARTATMYYVKTAVAGEWNTYLYVDGTNVTAGGASPDAVPMVFSATGALTNINGTGTTSATFDAYTPGGGANPITMTFDYAATTQFGSPFGVSNLTQNGYARGLLSGLETSNTGVVFARFTNGQSTALGKVALARFNNSQGLQPVSDTNWAQTFSSGDQQMGEAGTSSFGLIQSGALENSNVDIAEQLVNLITAQRNFQANAQVITTADTVTQTIINLR